MNKIVLDSSFICALVNKIDINHEQAFFLYKKFSNVKIFIPQVVLLEIAILKSKKYQDLHSAISKFLKIIQYEIFPIQISKFEDFIAQTNYNLKPNDYFILFVSQITNSKLLTFDKKLSNFFKP